MKSTCVLPPLSDILHSNNYHYHNYDQPQEHQYPRYNHHSNHYHSNQDYVQQQHHNRRRSSNSILHVSNLLSNTSSSEEEDYDDNEPVKAKRKRASPSQLSVLNRVFQQTFFPSTELRMELGKQLGMSPRTVQIWFQNKRQSLRTRERVITPPVSPYHKPSHISLPPLRLPSHGNTWPLTPTSTSTSPTSIDSILFRDA